MANCPPETGAQPVTTGETASPWSLWMWVLILAIAAVDAAWLVLTPVALSAASQPEIVRIACLTVLLLWLAGRMRHRPRIHTLLMGGAMLAAAWPALRLFNHLTMTTGFPLADAWLAGLDTAIGFDWLSYMLWLDDHPPIIRMMGLTYGGLTTYSIALFVILAMHPAPAQRCAEFVKLFLMTACTCMAVGMAFPALSAIVFHDPASDIFDYIAGRPGTYHLDALLILRENRGAVLDLRNLPGLVTFPSFHTAMGVVAIYCARHSAALFGLSLAVNLTMIASTPLFGAHYGIDIVAGAAVAAGAIALLRWTPALRSIAGPIVPKAAEAQPAFAAARYP